MNMPRNIFVPAGEPQHAGKWRSVRFWLADVEYIRADFVEEALNRIDGRIGEALAFAASVIRSGEPWSPECERIIGGALKELRK